VLVDTDLRRPTQHELFNLNDHGAPGVSDVLSGRATVDEALSETSVDGLRVMVAGTLPEAPDQLLRGKHFGQMKDRLREVAEIVVWDSPPVLMASDSMLLAESVDMTILVSEAGSTSRKAARKGAEALTRSNGGTVTAVLTRQRTGITGYGYGYGYSSYYGPDRPEDRFRRRVLRLASRLAFWNKRS
jgi:protein-tyrosine kinase